MQSSTQRRRDTLSERALGSELHRRGRRFRIDKAILTGTRRRHDFVFTCHRVVMEVRGCFWHACPVHGSEPRSNTQWWREKLQSNVDRDEDTAQRLTDAAWTLGA